MLSHRAALVYVWFVSPWFQPVPPWEGLFHVKAQNSSPSLRSLWLNCPPHSTGMEGVLLLGLQCLLPGDQDGSLEADFRGTKKACMLDHALDPWHKHLPPASVTSPPRWLLRAKKKVCTKSPFAVCNGQDNFSWLSFWYWHYYGLFKNTFC